MDSPWRILPGGSKVMISRELEKHAGTTGPVTRPWTILLGAWGGHQIEWRTVIRRPERDHLRERSEERSRGAGPGGPRMSGPYYGPKGPTSPDGASVWVEVRCRACGLTACDWSLREHEEMAAEVLKRLSSAWPGTCDEVRRELIVFNIMTT